MNFHGYFGAEYFTSAESKEIADIVLAENSLQPLLIFPQVSINDDEFNELANLIGTQVANPLLKKDDASSVVSIKRKSSSEFGAVYGGGWHSDLSFLDEQPTHTMFYGKVIPDVTHSTVFIDGKRVYDVLSEHYRRILSELTSKHEARHGQPPGTIAKAKTDGMLIKDNIDFESLHAFHPTIDESSSGEKFVRLRPAYVREFKELTKFESESILNYLYDLLKYEELTSRVIWQPNTLVIFNNHRLIHRATSIGSSDPRELIRTDLMIS